jgi:replication-associated recombination protein RarA
VRDVIERARRRLGEHGRGTILFLDEIHRFNKAQQDALLPAVEDGTLTLIGATTENPFFEVNPPLRSRSTLFRLDPLDAASLRTLAQRGLEALQAAAEPEAITLLVERAGGDGRQVLTSLEVARSPMPRRRCRRARSATGEMTTTTSSVRSSSRCADRTRTPPCTGWRGCSKPVKTHASSPGEW